MCVCAWNLIRSINFRNKTCEIRRKSRHNDTLQLTFGVLTFAFLRSKVDSQTMWLVGWHSHSTFSEYLKVKYVSLIQNDIRRVGCSWVWHIFDIHQHFTKSIHKFKSTSSSRWYFPFNYLESSHFVSAAVLFFPPSPYILNYFVCWMVCKRHKRTAENGANQYSAFVIYAHSYETSS